VPVSLSQGSQRRESPLRESEKATPHLAGVRFRSRKACLILVLILPFISLLLFAFLPFDAAFLIYLLVLLLCTALCWHI
jgi:hypothetical protein